MKGIQQKLGFFSRLKILQPDNEVGTRERKLSHWKNTSNVTSQIHRPMKTQISSENCRMQKGKRTEHRGNRSVGQ